ncbi:DUF3010 family protein [uncultured Marinobacter sp.]|uniref:DUF3010 family protein n=1 Tax=uncultured Marinobacter sp. TaxID=187379 RepID=UPI0026288854|nr:DUF3010 family protein [uncultured Marinobacter sp.]
MLICGVELSASDAVVCLLNLDGGQFTLPESNIRKITLKKNHTRKDLQEFQASFAKFLAEHDVKKVAIKERMPKGKFAGGAISFKMEAAIQLMPEADVEVQLLSSATIKATLSAKPMPIPFAATGLKVFQEAAFVAAYVGHLAK